MTIGIKVNQDNRFANRLLRRIKNLRVGLHNAERRQFARLRKCGRRRKKKNK